MHIEISDVVFYIIELCMFYRDKCWVPTVTLTSLVQRELHPRAPPPIPHIFKEETLRYVNRRELDYIK